MNRLVLFSLVLMIVAVFSCGKKQGGEQAKGSQGRSALNVDAIIVKSSLLAQQTTVAGTISANEEVELKPESTGKLIVINFKEGDFVQQGQL